MATYIRWLNAIRPGSFKLGASIKFEISRKDEAACEKLSLRHGELVSALAARGYGRKIGILIDSSCVFRHFQKDCWSEYNGNGQLVATVPANKCSDHNEHWAHMDGAALAIVVAGCSFSELCRDKQNAIRSAAKEYGLPIMKFVSGKLLQDHL